MDFSESAYGALLEEIFLRFPSVQKTDFARAYKPGLEGMEAFCEALGHPERSFRSIHIAGTNGKGSVASLLTSALSAVGLRTGLYTSPHLVDFRERARIVSPGLVSGREGLSSASLRDPIRANAPESPSPSESETSGSVIPSETKESVAGTASSRINVADTSALGLPEAHIRIACSQGTYIRAFARDLGEALGTGAHLSSLVRTKTGAFRLEDALSLEEALALLAD